MKKAAISILILLSISYYLLSQENTEEYLGQTPPGDTSILLRIGNYFENKDNRKRSFNFTFSPDGTELFFSYIKRTPEKPEPAYEIKTFKFIENKWVGPEVAFFSGKYSDVDINFSPNGKYIFFASDRPEPENSQGGIYYSNKIDGEWTEPISAGDEVNSVCGEVYPSISIRNNLFFRSRRPEGYGGDDLYRAEWVDEKFTNVQNLGPNINTQYGESNAVIAPDESYILFCSSRPENGNIQQIYISFQIGPNIWTKAESAGSEINSTRSGGPTISTDGKYLFFSKKDGVNWIRTDFIEDLRPLN